MTSPKAQAHERLQLTSTQTRYIANGVLRALRRGPTRITQGDENPFEIIGANSIPNGPGPLELLRYWPAYVPAHDGLDLPTVRFIISDATMRDAKYACTQREWFDLHRIALQTKVETLYYVNEHARSGWYAQRNPLAYAAPGAAATIIDLARLSHHVFLGETAVNLPHGAD